MLLQSQESDCGKAVVRNLLSILFHDKGFYTEKLKTTCSSFYEMREELDRYGIVYQSCHVDDIADIKKEMFPIICQMIHGDLYHFVIVLSMTRRKVSILDPCFGKMTISIEEFLFQFTGKLMIFKSCGKRRKAEKERNLMKAYEYIGYALCFLIQSASICSALLFTGKEKPFLPCLISTLVFFIFVILQNSLNRLVRHRLENQLILNGLENVGDKNRFSHVYNLITETVKCYSNAVSYSVLMVGLIVLILINSYYLAFLILISVLFQLIRMPIDEERNATNRYCSISEKYFFSKIENGREDDARKIYSSMRRKGEMLLYTIVFSWVLEAFSFMIFSFAIFTMSKSANINSILFTTSVSLSFSYALKSMMKILEYPENRAKEINALRDE